MSETVRLLSFRTLVTPLVQPHARGMDVDERDVRPGISNGDDGQGRANARRRPATATPPSPAGGLPAATMIFMALAAACGTSTIYLLQPAVADVARSLGSSSGAVGVALSCGPVGYMIGLALLVPMMDRFRPNRVLAVQFVALAGALVLGATVSTVAVLAPVVALTGACSVVGAGMTSVAGRLAAPHRRATVLGVVTAGISGGILAGRIVGGLLADAIGWREMLVAFALGCLALAAGCWLVLPAVAGSGRRDYLANLRSLPSLLVRHGVLRLAAARGALWFFAFCATWAGLAVALSGPPYSFSARHIGLYALAGLSGLLATQVAGRCTDRIGARRVILAGLAVAAVATVVMAIDLHSTPVTVAGLALFDAGLFAAQVANQSTVLSIDPTAPSRFNSAYMLVYFVGGSLGTAFGSAAVGRFGWGVTELMAAGSILGAAGLTMGSGRAAP